MQQNQIENQVEVQHMVEVKILPKKCHNCLRKSAVQLCSECEYLERRKSLSVKSSAIGFLLTGLGSSFMFNSFLEIGSLCFLGMGLTKFVVEGYFNYK